MNKVTDEQIQKVLIQTGGMISPAAHQLDVTRNAVYKRIRDNPDLRDALEEIRESLIDYAEGQLQRKIREGHPYLCGVAAAAGSQPTAARGGRGRA